MEKSKKTEFKAIVDALDNAYSNHSNLSKDSLGNLDDELLKFVTEHPDFLLMQDKFGRSIGILAAEAGLYKLWLHTIQNHKAAALSAPDGENAYVRGFNCDNLANHIIASADKSHDSQDLKTIENCFTNGDLTAAERAAINKIVDERRGLTYYEFARGWRGDIQSCVRVITYFDELLKQLEKSSQKNQTQSQPSQE